MQSTASARRADHAPGDGIAAGAPTPWPVVAVAAVGVAFVALPLVGLLNRVTWSTLWSDLTSPAALEAIRLSLICSVGATLVCVVIGTPMAWVLARVSFPGRAFVRGLVLLPLVLPPVVGGVALLAAFSRRGLIGSPLYDWFGIQLTFTIWGAVLAETFVALPFFVITVEAALRSVDRRYEDAARTLGADATTVFRRITVPAIGPGLIAGTVLAWARALGEFGATITFAGNVAGRTRTLPLAVYMELDGRPELAVALSLMLVVVSLGVIVALRERWIGS